MRYSAAILALTALLVAASSIASACNHKAEKATATGTITIETARVEAGLDAACAALVAAEGKLALLEGLEIETRVVKAEPEPAGPVATARASVRATGTVARAVFGTVGSVLAALARTVVHTVGVLT